MSGLLVSPRLSRLFVAPAAGSGDLVREMRALRIDKISQLE